MVIPVIGITISTSTRIISDETAVGQQLTNKLFVFIHFGEKKSLARKEAQVNPNSSSYLM